MQQEEVSGQVTILTSKSLLAPREIQLNGIPLILELGRAPADRNVGAAPKAASHLLSTLFPLPRGLQERSNLRKENEDTRRKCESYRAPL